MNSILLFYLLSSVYSEVAGHSLQLPKDQTFKSDICDAPYSCADCYSPRFCRTNTNGMFEFLGYIKCSLQRPYCDRSTGTCVSNRPSNCALSSSNISSNLSDNVCYKVFSCLDCKTAQICKPTIGGLVHFKDLPCSDENPYCNPKTGTCGKEQSFGCGKKGDFICVRDGKFPDIDCNKYHLCINLTSVTYSCASPFEHYDPRIGKCSESVPCQSFSCSPGMKVPHPMDSKFFAFCDDEGPIIIDSCAVPYELNITSQLCEATCHHNGLIQDLDDCRFYYKCTEMFLTESMSYFIKEKKQCPDGQAYNPTQYLCVSDISNIPGCKV